MLMLLIALWTVPTASATPPSLWRRDPPMDDKLFLGAAHRTPLSTNSSHSEVLPECCRFCDSRGARALVVVRGNQPSHPECFCYDRGLTPREPEAMPSNGAVFLTRDLYVDPTFQVYLRKILAWNKDQFSPPCEVVARNNYTSGLYHVVYGHSAFSALCEIVPGRRPLQLIQRRISGQLSFTQNASRYENGFGRLDNEFWYGLHTIAGLLNSFDLNVYIEMRDLRQQTMTHTLTHVRLGTARQGYPLITSQIKGEHRGLLEACKGKRFNDSGWWGDGLTFNPNGLYLVPMVARGMGVVLGPHEDFVARETKIGLFSDKVK